MADPLRDLRLSTSTSQSDDEAAGSGMRARNHSLDGLRGVAVTLVYLVHYCGTYMATFRGANPNGARWSAWSGAFDKTLYWLFHSHHGVYIFFVLSGFLISKICASNEFWYPTFVRSRLLRIYPAFLLALVVCLALSPFLGIPFPSAREIVLNLLFLNGVPPLGVTGIVFNNVTWSLWYEMVFYLSFPLLLLVGRTAGASAIGTISLAGIIMSYLPGLIGFYAEFFLFLFVGAIIGSLPTRVIGPVARSFPDAVAVLLYLIPTTLFAMDVVSASQFVWMFAGASAVILCKAVEGGGWLAQMLAWPPLVSLGRISYSFYLLHSVALATIFAAWWILYLPILGEAGNAAYLGIVGFALAVGLAWMSYMIAERFYFRIKLPAPTNSTEAVQAA